MMPIKKSQNKPKTTLIAVKFLQMYTDAVSFHLISLKKTISYISLKFSANSVQDGFLSKTL